MRFFRRRNDADLLERIIDRQQGPQPRPRSSSAPKARRPPRARPAIPWRFYKPFIIVLAACSVAAGVYVDRDHPALLGAIDRITGQAAQVAPATGTLTGRASIIDADTIEIRGQRIRLWGVDAPESAQLCQRDGQAWRCGQAAALALAEWIGQRTTICEDRGTGGWNRALGLCRVGGTDVSAWLVENGWAMAFRRYSLDYVAHEDRARRMRAGVWASEFIAPWEWRASRQAPRR